MLARYLDVELPGENWDVLAKVKEVGHDWHLFNAFRYDLNLIYYPGITTVIE